MPNTFEKRARDALEAKDDSFRPHGEKNRARFEELKREMRKELAGDVAQGKQSIRHAGNKAVRRISNAADAAEQSEAVSETWRVLAPQGKGRGMGRLLESAVQFARDLVQMSREVHQRRGNAEASYVRAASVRDVDARAPRRRAHSSRD